MKAKIDHLLLIWNLIELSKVKFHEKENLFDCGGICLASGDNFCGLFHKYAKTNGILQKIYAHR